MAVHQKRIESFGQLVFKRFRKHRLALVAAVILMAMCLLSLLAPFITQWLGVNYDTTALEDANLPAGFPHLLGTNELGQDVFARLIYGSRVSLSVGILSAVTSACIGALIGILAGYYGGLIDVVLMRFTDAMLSVPVLPLMIVFAALDLTLLLSHSASLGQVALFLAALGGLGILMRVFRAKQVSWSQVGHWLVDTVMLIIFCLVAYAIIFKAVDWSSLGRGNMASVVKLILIIVFFGWMTVARLARASALQLKSMEFVSAAKALGASDKRILLWHIMPNALAPIIVAATLEVGGNILYEASLSFLGLGIQPPVSSWGNMLNNAVDYIKTSPSLAFWPGFFILLTVSCFNFFGDGMRDALDPHQVMQKKSA